MLTVLFKLELYFYFLLWLWIWHIFFIKQNSKNWKIILLNFNQKIMMWYFKLIKSELKVENIFILKSVWCISYIGEINLLLTFEIIPWNTFKKIYYCHRELKIGYMIWSANYCIFVKKIHFFLSQQQIKIGSCKQNVVTVF